MRTRQKARLEASAAQISEEASDFLSLGSVEKGKTEPQKNGVSSTGKDLLATLSQTNDKKPSSLTISLSSSLDPGPKPGLYFTCDPDKMADRILAGVKGCPQAGTREKEVVQDCVITPDFEQKDCAPPISISKHERKKINQAARAASTGSKWFDMPAPQLTPQLKNDLRLLQMRNALDPSRHYKANDSKKLPRYFQVGRVVADSADFYSSRIPRRQRKQTLVDELLSDEEFKRYHKKKYLELQKKFMSGTGRRKNIPLKKKFKKKF